MVEGRAITTVECLTTVTLYLWETVALAVLQRCGHKRSASLLYLDAL
jgi:hypothetical protein